MVYKKFIKRNGKLYGPYYYKSERINGKVINTYVDKEDVPVQNETKSVFGVQEKTFYLTLIVLGIVFVGFLLVSNLQLGGKTTGFFSFGDQNVSEKFVDSLTRSALENVEFDWAPSNVCDGGSCYLIYAKISGVINAEKSGSASIYLIDGERKLKILEKTFELNSITNEEITAGSGTMEEVCNTETKEVCVPETKEVCHDETAEDGTVTSVCENQETQVCTNEEIQVCENVTIPGEETIQNITTEVPEDYSFDEVCDETCALSGFDKTSYKISVELDDGITAEITSISYQWENVAVVEENESIPVEPLLNETLLNETVLNETGNFNWTTTILNNYGGGSKEIGVKIVLPLSLKNSTDEIDGLNAKKKDKGGKGDKVILSAEEDSKLKKAKDKIKNFTKNRYNKVYLSSTESAIKDITFNNIVVENDTISLGVSSFVDAKYVQTYSIDPTQVNFTSAEVIVTAKGNSLLKCKDWNFTSQTCFGSWAKIKDITPGSEYMFTLTAEDPGYGEILITVAQHLNSTYGFISDVYNQTSAHDEIWSEPIYANQYIRAIFESNLANGNAIDFVVRNNRSLNTYIEVYGKDGSVVYGSTSVITSSGDYNLTLSGMSGVNDTFDIKVVNAQNNLSAFLEFDYVKDASSGISGANIPFFMTSEHVVGNQLVDLNEFDEYPISINDYSQTTEKCGDWKCTAWSMGTGNGKGEYCSGIWNCTSFNGNSCAKYSCSAWTLSATARRDVYCSSGWNCTKWDGNSCSSWGCATFTLGTVNDVAKYCSGIWNCTKTNGSLCSFWNCTVWSDAAATDTDNFCSSGWKCLDSSPNSECKSWNCSIWSNGTIGDTLDRYCSGVINCTQWNNGICSLWNCTARSVATTTQRDVYCEDFKCTNWDVASKACGTWNCTKWNESSTNQRDFYCSGDYNCTSWQTFTYDTTPPAAITNLSNQSAGLDWIYWNWTNPADSDFNSSIIFLNGANIANTSSNFYNATGLNSGSQYNLTVWTKDNTGNINSTNVTSSAMTLPISSFFGKCINITIKNAGSTALTNFPAYINLTNRAGMLANYADLRFYNNSCNSGGSLLDYEIENYTSTNAHIWVRIPTLETGNTTIALYYQNFTAVSSGANPTGVWDSNYKMVLHLKETSGGTVYGSTSNGNNGTVNGSAYTASGYVDGAYYFNGVNNEIDALNTSSLAITGNLTVEAWAKPNNTGVYVGIVGKINDSAPTYIGYALTRPTTNKFRFQVANSNAGTLIDSASTYADTNWHYVVGVINGTGGYLFVDGVQQGNNATATFGDDGKNLTIGRHYINGPTPRYFNGTIDEVRLSATGRSAGWINQTYQMIANQNSFVTFGNEQIQDTTAPSITLLNPADGVTNTNGFVQFFYNTTDPDDNVSSCSLILNGTVNSTSNSVTKGIQQQLNAQNLRDGNYSWKINCTDTNGNQNSSAIRYVNVKYPTNVSNGTIVINQTMRDSSGNALNATITLIETGTGQTDYNTSNGQSQNISSGTYDIQIALTNSDVKTVTFLGVNVTGNITSLINIDNSSNSQFGDIYGVYPTINYNYSSINITITASFGRFLFKCSNWNFTNRLCIDEKWKKIGRITPGQNYTIIMYNSADPGFGELNDLLVVLDYQDYLVNSNQTVLRNQSDVYDVQVNLTDNAKVTSVNVYNYNDSALQSDLKLEEGTSVPSGYVSAYSVDTSNLSNSNITVTAIASENMLYKCANWSFSTQICNDNNWIVFKTGLVPGETYIFTLLPGDPGFAGAINTTYILHNESDSQFTNYKQMKNVSVDVPSVSSEAAILSNNLITCWNASWITPNQTSQALINGTWNFNIYTNCSAAFSNTQYNLRARILKVNSTGEFNFVNSSTAGFACAAGASTVKSWTFNVSNSSNTLLQVGERAGARICVQVTGGGAANKYGWMHWENNTPSNIVIPVALFITSPEVHLISPANNTFTTTPSQTFGCNITSTGIANLTLNIWNSTGVLNYINTTVLTGTTTNSTSWVYTLPYDNSWKWNCLGRNTQNDQSYSTEGNYTITLDRASPYFTTIPASANINYTQGFSVQFNATDNIAFGSYAINWTTLFAINSTGSLYNTTQLSAGVYNINVTINDTSNNLNSTIYQVTANKASSQTSLIFDKTSSQPYPTAITPTCSILVGGSEALGLTNGTSGVPETLGAGIWNFNCSYPGNANYSASSNLTTFQITKADPSGSMNITGTTPIIYPTTSDFASSENNTGDGGCSYALDKSNGIYGAGTTTFNYSTSGCANYSAGSVTKNLVVQQNTTYMLGISGTTPMDYGNTTDVAGSGCPSELTCSLSPSNGAYGAGTTTFNYSTAGNTNYSTSSITEDIVINKATPTLIFLANGGTSNLTLESPQQVNISAIASTGTVGLDKDGVNYLANNGLNITLGLGSYIFRANITGNQNYSDVGYSYYNITIRDTIAPAISIVYPQNIIYNHNVTALNYTVSDANLQACWYSTNLGVTNTTITPCGNNVTGLISPGGNNTWIVWANDSVGHVNFSSVTFNVYICAQNITYTDWSDWQNGTCAISQMNQSRSRIEYDSNNCGGTPNQTIYDYGLVGPTYQNTSWGNWTNITCLPTNYQNQSRNWTQFDIYGCAGNTTNFEYRNNVEVCDFDSVPPTWISHSIEPYDPAVGSNVSLSANATDINGVSGIFANITLPNGTVVVLTLPANYTILLAGRYNVTFWANDSLGNIATYEDYFIAAVNSVNVVFNTIDSDMNGVPVDLTVYFAGTDKEVHQHDFTGNMSDEHGDLIYDLYYQIIGTDSSVRLNGVNLSLDNNGTLGFDMNNSISGYLVVYGLNSTYGFSNATLVLSYGGLAFLNENNLVLEKCSDWDFTARTCASNFADITSQATQDESGNTFTITVTSFSGFGIREVTPTTPTTPTGGKKVYGGYLPNETAPGIPETPGTPEEVPFNPIKEIENAFKVLKTNYNWVIFLLIAIEIVLWIILTKRRKKKEAHKRIVRKMGWIAAALLAIKMFFVGLAPRDEVKHTEWARPQRAAEFEHSLWLKCKRLFGSACGICFGFFEGIAGFITHLVSGVKMLVFGISNVFGHIIKGVFEFVGSIIYGLAFFFTTIVHQFIYFVSGLVELSRSFVYGMEKSFVRFVIHGLKMFLISTLQAIAGIFEAVVGLVNAFNDGTRKALVRIIRAITAGVIGVFSLAISLIKGVLTFFVLFGKSIVTFFKRIVEFVYTSSHKIERNVKLAERRTFRRLYDEITGFASASAEGTRRFFDSLIYLIQHDARLAERRYSRRIMKREHYLVSRVWGIIKEFVEEIVKFVQIFVNELGRMFKSIYSRFAMLLKHEEMKPSRKEESSEDVLPEGFDFDKKDIVSRNAEKIKLEQYIKKLDSEYQRGTLDTRAYLKTRENLLKELWKLKH